MSRRLSLGIDTSNYKTSAAVVDHEGHILFNHQAFLEVKRGERGLRQSEALFQHVQRMPKVLEEIFKDEYIRNNIGAVSVSSRPRPVEGSYMPVFTAGTGYARSVAAALGVPCYEFSHQEGHLEAVKFYSAMKAVKGYICFHFSGGTTEALYVDESTGSFDIAGGSRDLACGQVLDRVGVAMGFDFPCGQEIDRLACDFTEKGKYADKSLLSKVKVSDCFVNLSGIETQASRLVGHAPDEDIAAALLMRLSESVLEMTLQLSEKYGVNDFLFAGGVSCSKYMRSYLKKNLPGIIQISFGDPELSSDNAVGTALLGGRKIWL